MAFDLGALIYKLSLDSKKFTEDLKKASSGIESFGKKSTEIGKKLTTSLTLPIVGLGAAAVKLAADAEIAGKKFSAAFRGSLGDANEAVEELNESYSISISESTKLLANTGDLLKGFGATAGGALDTSLAVQQLSAQLAAASTSGLSVAQASENVTKALFGETEGLKQLGVVIRQADIDNQLLEDGTSDLTGQQLLLARAQATLKLAIGQSGDAIANFAENQDTVANQSKALLGELKDLGVQFGTILLPVVKDIVKGLRDAVEWFSSLDEETKKLIIQTALFAAAAGPVVGIVGKLASGFGELAKNAPKIGGTLAKLGAVGGPLALVAAGAVAAAVGWVALKNASVEYVNELRDKRINEELGEVADNMDRIGDGQAAQRRANALRAMEDGFDRINFGVQRDHLEEVTEQLYIQSEQYGISAEALVEAALATSAYRDELAGQAEELRAIAKQIDEDEAAAVAYDLAETKRKAEEAAATQRQIQLELDRKNGVDELTLAYKAQREVILGILGEEKTEVELLQEQIDELNLAWADGSGLENDRLKAIEVLQGRIDGIRQEEHDEEARLQEEKLDRVNEYLKAKSEAEQKARDDKKAADDQAAEEEAVRLQQNLEAITSTAQTIAGLIQGIQSQAATNAKALTDEFMATNGEEIKALEEKEETSAGLTEAESKRLDELNKQKNELAQEQYDRELAAFNTNKSISLARTAMAGYEAGIQAFKALAGIPVVGPGLGAAAATTIAGLTLELLGKIHSQQPPPPPQLAEGGLINPSIGGTHAVIGEAGSQEAVIPLNDAFFERLASAAQGSTAGSAGNSARGGNSTQINIILDSQVIGSATVDLINNKQLFISAGSVV